MGTHINPLQILCYVCEDNIVLDITTLDVIIIWPAVRDEATKLPDLPATALNLWEHHPTTTVPITNNTACKKFGKLVVLQCYMCL